MKNVLVITSSFRNGSNSEALADAFIAGAKFGVRCSSMSTSCPLGVHFQKDFRVIILS